MCAIPPAATTSCDCSTNTARALSDSGSRYTPSRSATAPLALSARQMRMRAVLFSPDTLLTSISHSSGMLSSLHYRSTLDSTLCRRTPVKWVTRERPKIDRIACPWLIARFIDREPEFLFVPPGDVLATARDRNAIPYDVPDVELTHVGEQCSFDAFLSKYGLDYPALAELAVIVRGADTGRPQLAPQAAGLLAISLGLSYNYRDDHEMLKHGLVVYDALYAWCRHTRSETHTWNPAAIGAYGANVA